MKLKKPIKTLLDEHTVISTAISVAKKIQQINDETRYRDLVHDLIIFFRNYTELHHHPKEEDILYPFLRNKSESMGPVFIHKIWSTHEDLKSTIAEMEKHYINYDNPMLRKTMDRYLDSYEVHIEDENRAVLSLAENLISDEEEKELFRQFQILEEKNDISSKKELNEMLHNLSLAI